MKVHPFIEAEKAAGHSVARACDLLEVSRAAYYQRRSGVPSPRAVDRRRAVGAGSRHPRRLQGHLWVAAGPPELLRRDVACGKRRVTRLMRAAGLEGRCKKRWRTTTVADPDAEASPRSHPAPLRTGPETDRRYVGDITYIATWEGWAYLATVIDLASRKVVGWALADHMRTELVDDALSHGVHPDAARSAA